MGLLQSKPKRTISILSIGNYITILDVKSGKIIEIEKYYVAKHWERFGGSFTKALAEALDRADRENTRIILNNWKHYWEGDIDIILDNQLKEDE